jgi:hypothetical protein
MRPDAANIEADAERGVRKRNEWFAKHSRTPQREGFFDAAFQDEKPGRCPTSRLLRKYANFADALKGFCAIRPSPRMPSELEDKTWVDVCGKWDTRRTATRAWEELQSAGDRFLTVAALAESKLKAAGGHDAGRDWHADPNVVLARRQLEEKEAAYAAARGAEILPVAKVEAGCDRFRRRFGALTKQANNAARSLAEAERDGSSTRASHTLEARSRRLQERAERAEAEWHDAKTRRLHQRLIDRWEALIIAREPLRRMIDALGPHRTDYEAAETAWLEWERESAKTTGRMSVRPNHPDPRSRASWEIRRWILPLRYAYSDPRRFFTEIAPRYDQQVFDPQSIGPFETPRYLGALAACLREWGYGALLHPAVRAAFDAAAQDSPGFGEMLAIAERKTTFPQEGPRAVRKRKRQKRVKPLAERMTHWQTIFQSRNHSGRRRLLEENGISLKGSNRLPTVEGCALRVCAKESNASLGTTRKRWMREKLDTRSN